MIPVSPFVPISQPSRVTVSTIVTSLSATIDFSLSLPVAVVWIEMIRSVISTVCPLLNTAHSSHTSFPARNLNTSYRQVGEIRTPDFYLYIRKNVFQSITPILNFSIEKAVDLQWSNRFSYEI